jgi:hypothetical protein
LFTAETQSLLTTDGFRGPSSPPFESFWKSYQASHGAKTNLIPSNKNMKANTLKIVGLAIALASFGAVCIVGTHA